MAGRGGDDPLSRLHADKLRLAEEIGARQRAEMADFMADCDAHERVTRVHEAEARAYATDMAVYEERDKLVARLDEDHFRPPSLEQLRECLQRHSTVSADVSQLYRETYVDLPGASFSLDLRLASLDPNAKRPAVIRFGEYVAQVLPRRNPCVFSFTLLGTGRLGVSSLEDLVADLQQLISQSILEAAEKRLKDLPRNPRLVLDGRHWEPLAPDILTDELSRLCSSFRFSVVLECPHPSPGAAALVGSSTFEGAVLEQRAVALEDAIRRLLVSARQPLPVRAWRAPPASPQYPPGAPPSIPRLATGTYPYWRELPFEMHYQREACVNGKVTDRMVLGFLQLQSGEWGPLVFSRKQLHYHAHITGASGSGKTPYASFVITQLIRGSDEPDGAPAPIIVLDPKDDAALRETLRIEASKRGMRFRYFTPDPNLDSETLDLLGSLLSITTDAESLGEVLGRGLELYHGPGYGRSHFGRQNQTTTALGFGAVLKDAVGGQPLTFDGIIKGLQKLEKSKRPPPGFNRAATSEALACLRALAARRRLVLDPSVDPRNVIHLERVIENRELLYIHCSLSSPGSLDIGRLILFVVSELCRKRKTENRKRQCYAFVDEFSELLGQNVGMVLATAGGSGLSLLMANQSLSQLQLGDGVSLLPAVVANVNLRVFLTASEVDDVEEVQRLSGEKLEWLRQVSLSADQKTGRGVADARTWNVTNSITTGTSQFSSVGLSSGSSSGSGPGGYSGSSHSGRTTTHGTGSHVDQSQSVSQGGSHTDSAQKVDGMAVQLGFRETPRPALDPNSVARISSRRDEAFIWTRQDETGREFSKAEGLLRPFHILYLTDLDEYNARLRASWKAATGAEASNGEAPSATTPRQAPVLTDAKEPRPKPEARPRPSDPRQSERGRLLQDFFSTHYPHSPEGRGATK